MLLKVGIALLVLPLVVLMGFWGSEYAEVSTCIHTGGSFDYLTGQCVEVGQGVFITFAERYPSLVQGCLTAACIGLLLCLAGLYVSRS